MAVLAVSAAAILPYLRTIDDYFVRDDFGVVQLLADKPATSFPRWFVTSWMDDIWGFVPDEVRPFPAVTYQITALPGAATVWAHHALNLALHAVNALLVLVMARRVAGLRLEAAALAALVFALLPVCAESVAWITGRVDSLPALLYVGSFLLYVRWRGSAPAPSLYWASVAVYFAALFSKQNAITLPVLLVACDALEPGGLRRTLGRRVAAYLPFAALTAGYLALRYALFGQVAREEQLRADTLPSFAGMAARHLADVVIGRRDAEPLLVWGAVGVACALALAARGAGERRAGFRTVLLFGAVWWSLGVAPVVVAGYESPRHVYLAAMGWAVLIGAAFHQLWGLMRAAWWRLAVAAAAVALLLTYGARLVRVVDDWRTTAEISARAVRLVEAAATRAPPGALVIAGVPRRSWEWALPFAARPPFAATDLTARVHIVSPWMLHCCRVQWFDETRRTLTAWSQGPGREAVTVVRADAAASATLSTEEHPGLAVVARLLLDLDRHEHLDETLQRLIESVR